MLILLKIYSQLLKLSVSKFSHLKNGDSYKYLPPKEFIGKKLGNLYNKMSKIAYTYYSLNKLTDNYEI